MAMQETQSVATDETSALISSDKVEGTAVYNREGEKLGSINSVMIDKVSGKVAYAVMSFGGFLGMGDRYHPLPWHVLTYDTAQGGYVIDLDPGMLEGGPDLWHLRNARLERSPLGPAATRLLRHAPVLGVGGGLLEWRAEAHHFGLLVDQPAVGRRRPRAAFLRGASCAG